MDLRTKKILLIKRPSGELVKDCFKIEAEAVPKPDQNEILIKILKEMLSESIEIPMGDMVKKKNETTYFDYLKKFKPGDTGYINAVLIEKVQNELGAEIK